MFLWYIKGVVDERAHCPLPSSPWAYSPPIKGQCTDRHVTVPKVTAHSPWASVPTALLFRDVKLSEPLLGGSVQPVERLSELMSPAAATCCMGQMTRVHQF